MFVRSHSPLARILGRAVPVLLGAIALAATGCDREPVACAPEPPVEAPGRHDPAPASPPPASQAPTASAADPISANPTAPAALVEPPRAAEPKATRLRVKRLVLAEGVDAREPLGPRSAFRAGEMDKVYAFVEVENPERRGGAITVSFEPPDGPEIGNVHLDVGASPRWRTWAFSRAVRQTGEWTAIVRDESGRIIAREPFSVTL